MQSLGKKVLKLASALIALLLLVLVLNANAVLASETYSGDEKGWGESLIESSKQLAKLASLAKAIVDLDVVKLLLKAIVSAIKAWGSALDKYVLVINPFIENKILDTEKFVLVPLGIYTSIAMIVMSVLHAMFTSRDTSMELKQAIYRYLTYFLVVPIFVVFVLVITKTTDRITWLMADTIVGDHYTFIYGYTNKPNEMLLDTKTLLLSFITTSLESKAHPLIALISVIVYFVGSLLLIFYGIFRRFILTALIISAPLILALPIFPNIKSFDPVLIVLKLCFQQIGVMLGLLISLLFVINSDGSEILATVVPLLAFIITFTLAKNAGDIVKQSTGGLSYSKGIPYLSSGYKQLENYRNRGVSHALPSPESYPLLETKANNTLAQANSLEFYTPLNITKVRNESSVKTDVIKKDSKGMLSGNLNTSVTPKKNFDAKENTNSAEPNKSKTEQVVKKTKKLNTERKAY